MNLTPSLLAILLAFNPAAASPAQTQATASTTVLKENFTSELSQDWFWGLGTWAAQKGVLRGFESGPRRHGPVKVRRLAFREADIRFEFRLEGRASFASFPMDGAAPRGHILNVVMGRRSFRIIAHPKKGESLDLVREDITLQSGDWHPVRLSLKGDEIRVEFNGKVWSAKHPVVAELKASFGFGGDSGGPEGERAGALEFRHFEMSHRP